VDPERNAAIGRTLAGMRDLRVDRRRAAELLGVPGPRLEAGADRLGPPAGLGLAELLALSVLLPDELPAARLWPRAVQLVAGWLAAAPVLGDGALVVSADQVALESDPLAIAFEVASHVAIAFPLLEAADLLLARLAPRAPGGRHP
jgi:hypothetical protein